MIIFALTSNARHPLCSYTERRFRNTGREEVCCVSNKAAVSGETHLQTHTEYRGVICHWGQAGAAVAFCVTLMGDGFSEAAGSELHLPCPPAGPFRSGWRRHACSRADVE